MPTTFNVRQALFKAADGEEYKWSQVAHSVFWVERIMIRKRMGCSPYYAAMGTHLLIPMDIVKATYLQPAPDSVLSRTNLIMRRAIVLQKRVTHLDRFRSRVFEAHRKVAIRFDEIHIKTIQDFDFKHGDLVLMHNSQIEKSLNRK